MATEAPRFAQWVAMTRPMPREDPVTKATFPTNALLFAISWSPCLWFLPWGLPPGNAPPDILRACLGSEESRNLAALDGVAADGRLYIRYADGTMTLVKASPDALEEVGSFKVPGSGDRPSWSHPVITGGRLYLREQDALYCYDIKK